MKLVLAFALLLSSPAFAADAIDTSGMQACSLGGYSTDTDPKGTNVRSAPDVHAAIVGHLPPETVLPGDRDSYAAEFDILGSKNGWLLIENAQIGQYENSPVRTVFKGPGWISGALVGFTIGSQQLRSGPDAKSKVVAQLDDESKGQGADSWAVKRVYACQGGAVDILTVLASDPHAKPIRGWAHHVCANQVTTCDPG